MWKRRELKEKAKKVIKRNYWTVVIVCFIIAICTGEYGISTVGFERNFESANIAEDVEDVQDGDRTQIFSIRINSEKHIGQGLEHFIDTLENTVNATINSTIKTEKYIYKIVDGVKLFIENNKLESITLFATGVTAFLFIVFVSDPLIVGEKRFFLKVRRSTKTKIGIIGSIFKRDQWFKVAKIMLLKNVYIFLWYFTIIGGFIKTYQYQMVPYIIAENPHMKSKEVFELSKQMMKGNKWKSFVLDVSFLLWDFLSLITLGLIGILYVNPYTEATKTELYVHLRKQAIKKKYEYYENLIEEKVKAKKEDSSKKLKEA